jgi:hypothetical protein
VVGMDRLMGEVSHFLFPGDLALRWCKSSEWLGKVPGMG